MTKQTIISEYIFPITKFGKIGVIHSTFEQSFNIKIGKQLINIGSFPNYLPSFGIYLPNQQFRQIIDYVKKGDRVKIDSDTLTFYNVKGVQQLHFNNVVVAKLNKNQFHFNLEQLKILYSYLADQKLENKIGIDVDNHSQKIFQEMSKKNSEFLIIDAEKIVSYLIGRGKGLTPSGDDILSGYLLMLSIENENQSNLLAKVLLSSELSTADVSVAYLISTVDGYMNSLFYKLFHYLDIKSYEKIEETLNAILKIGHTSGADMAYGLFLALKSLDLNQR